MQKQTSIIIGLALIAVGLLFLLLQAFPDVAARVDFTTYWPLILVGVGALFLVAALLGSAPLAVPGSVLTGIGLLLTYQNISGNWASWSYAWALIPGFVGIGVMLMGLLDAEHREQVSEGFRLLLISLGLLVLFGGIFGAFGAYWPVLLILGGILLLWRGRPHGKNDNDRITPSNKDA
ncbi:MAG: hypothetical protein ACK2UK_11735 [Candidatus Promineifilaceae bacterium]|jgi:hypothetical protein